MSPLQMHLLSVEVMSRTLERSMAWEEEVSEWVTWSSPITEIFPKNEERGRQNAVFLDRLRQGKAHV